MNNKTKKQAIYLLLLIPGIALSVAGNVYQGYNYAPSAILTFTTIYMVVAHLLIDIAKFSSINSIAKFHKTNQKIKRNITILIFLIAASISMFSTGNMLNKSVKKNITLDNIAMKEYNNKIASLQNKITQGNNNPFIQNCKWALSANNNQNGSATKAFCNLTDSKGKLQKNSRPALQSQIFILSAKVQKLKQKEYFPMTTYLKDVFNIPTITTINTLIGITMILLELIFVVTPYFYKPEIKTEEKEEKVIQPIKTTQHKKVKSKIVQKETPKTIKLKINSVDTYLKKDTLKQAATINSGDWKHYFTLYQYEIVAVKLGQMKLSDRKHTQEQIAKELHTSQGTVSKEFKQLELSLMKDVTLQNA